MNNQFSNKLFDIGRAIKTSSGGADPTLRTEIASYAGMLTLDPATSAEQIPEELRPYITKVVKHAYKTTDHDIEQLKAAGYSEDELYELTISAAFGAGYARYQQGLALLNENSANQIVEVP